MAQGFKPLKKAPAAAKGKGKSSSAPKPKAGRVIAPKKPNAIQEAKQRKVRARVTAVAKLTCAAAVSYTHL